MRINEISSLPRYDGHAGKLPPPLDADERQKQAIRYYQEHGYAGINADLRGTKREWAPMTREEMMTDYGWHMDDAESIQHLDTLMTTAPRRKRTIKVYRGESNSDHAEKLASMEIGESFVDPGYLSTSVRPAYGFYAFARRGFHGDRKNNIVSMFLVPPSVKAINLDTVGDDPSPEAEFLIGRGSTYTLAEKRLIPNGNKSYHEAQEIQLLIWKVS